MMMNKKILFIVFLISGFAFAQTTVTLEDQCNCEVLSGIDVTAPGASTPTGADIGDIYVNTNTGTIYFWDGNTWELTSTDSQQLQNFSFDSGTNLLSLDIENGNTVSVDLTDLADQNAAEVNLNNPIDVDNDGNNEVTVEEAIADLAANNALDLDIDPTNELTTSGVGAPTGAPANDNPGVTYLDTATNELYVYNGTNWAMVTDNQEGTEVDLTTPIDVDNDGNNEVTVEEAIADLAANNALDLDIDPTNELTTSGVGAPTGAPANDNLGVTYLDTATNELYVYDGTNWTMVTDNQNAGEVSVTPAGNITSTNVQAALEELDASITSSELTTTIVEGTGIDVTSSVAGNNTEYTVAVDPTDIVGDGSIASSDIDVTGGSNATLNDVTLTIADNAITNVKMADDAITTTEILDGTITSADIAADAVNASTINVDVAGSGLTQNVTTGALEVNEAALADGNITSGDNTIDVTGGDDSVFTDVVLDVTDNAITNAKLADNAVQTENIVNGTILAEDISSGGNDKVLVTNPAGVVEWIDKSTLVPATTVSNTSSGNTLSTTVDGVTGANVSIINSNTLTLNGSDELVSTVNGVDSNAIDLSPYVNNDTNEIQDLELTGDDLTLTNDPTATAIDLSDYRETVVGTGDIGVTDDGNGNYAVNYVDGDSDSTNELTVLSNGAPVGAPANNNVGATYVDESAGQLYVWDGSAWDVVGGSATPIADIVTTLVDHGDGSFTYTNENNDDVIFRASTISDNGNGTSTITTADGDTLTVDNDGVDNDTQYTAGNGLNLDVSNVFTAVASPDANNALDVRANGIYATDDQNAGEVSVNPAGNITSTNVQSALEELDASITSSELTTTVVEGTGIDVTSSVTGNNTEYTVNVEEAAIADGNITSASTIDVTGGDDSVFKDVVIDVTDNAITNAKLADDAVQSSNILNEAVTLSKLADGTADGQVMRWDNTLAAWTLVDLGSVTVTENDGVIGNEVVGVT
ncbi:hypothetical protein, partial [uncultured Maribacter sp.]|uniref:beta strand repeat-containing protein n=1 Tax=uncultured Maribacter sp. TaxID=431308 RepID=UPI00262886B7